jgi:hypothetical protein
MARCRVGQQLQGYLELVHRGLNNLSSSAVQGQLSIVALTPLASIGVLLSIRSLN